MKNLYLSPSKNPLRKAKEALITWRMERALSKKRILEIYLNVVEWGGRHIRHRGPPRSATTEKSASSLGAEEAARLAAVLPNPRRYRADKTSRYVEKRTRIIYHIMVKRGIVAPEYEEVTGDSASAANAPPAGDKGIMGEAVALPPPPEETAER